MTPGDPHDHDTDGTDADSDDPDGRPADGDDPVPARPAGEAGPGPPAWPVVAARVEYETGWYTGGYDEVEQPDGSTKRYYWAELPPAAVVVAPLEGELLMIEQYRPTIRELCLELPAGIVETGESFAAAGARELAEETGYRPAETTLVESYWCATGVLRHERGIVHATDLTPVDRRLDGNEFLDVVRVPIEAALERARAGPANDATLEGILLAREDGLI